MFKRQAQHASKLKDHRAAREQRRARNEAQQNAHNEAQTDTELASRGRSQLSVARRRRITKMSVVGLLTTQEAKSSRARRALDEVAAGHLQDRRRAARTPAAVVDDERVVGRRAHVTRLTLTMLSLAIDTRDATTLAALAQRRVGRELGRRQQRRVAVGRRAPHVERASLLR